MQGQGIILDIIITANPPTPSSTNSPRSGKPSTAVAVAVYTNQMFSYVNNIEIRKWQLKISSQLHFFCPLLQFWKDIILYA